jgi:hypothetical protein
MVSVLASSAVDHGFNPWSGQVRSGVKPNHIILVLTTSPLSMQHQGVRAKTGCQGNRTMSTCGLLLQ